MHCPGCEAVIAIPDIGARTPPGTEVACPCGDSIGVLYTKHGRSPHRRNRWTVTYPDGDYGMVDALAEAKAWAAQDAEERARRST